MKWNSWKNMKEKEKEGGPNYFRFFGLSMPSKSSFRSPGSCRPKRSIITRIPSSYVYSSPYIRPLAHPGFCGWSNVRRRSRSNGKDSLTWKEKCTWNFVCESFQFVYNFELMAGCYGNDAETQNTSAVSVLRRWQSVSGIYRPRLCFGCVCLRVLNTVGGKWGGLAGFGPNISPLNTKQSAKINI